MNSEHFSELTEELKPLVGHVKRSSKDGWIVRWFKGFEIDTEGGAENFVKDFYNSKDNTFFIENMELIVEKYYNETMIVFNKWKEICKNN